MNYHFLDIDETVQLVETNIQTGLSTNEVEIRRNKFGMNELPRAKKELLIIKFLKQFNNVLVIVLIAAALLSWTLGETLDAYVILAIVVLNAIMGFVQEAKAEKALEALKKMETTYCKVLRNATVVNLKAQELVPGDIIILETGEKIPADARLIEAVNLEVSESILTGESHPVDKQTEEIKVENLAIADRTNLVFKDTTIINGRGKAIVVSTGINTEIGKISKILQTEQEDKAPLAKNLDAVGKRLSFFAMIIILVILGVGVLSGSFNLKEAFFTAISLAVAAIPEGLPAIVTIVLAIGVSRLSKAKALIRKLNSVETLGSTNYILTDKTGTLTQNVMTVTDIAFIDSKYEVTEKAKFINAKSKKDIDIKSHKSLKALLNAVVLCGDVQVSISTEEQSMYLGDSTEVALVQCAANAGIKVSEVVSTYSRLFEIPFSSETKKMVVVVKDPINENNCLVIAKGAPEIISQMVMEDTRKIEHINEQFTKKGLRSLAVSYKNITLDELDKAKKTKNPEDILSTYHTFLGIMAQKDPLRPEIKQALHKAKTAGIETIMLTGDNLFTAKSIAKDIGLINSDDQAVEGKVVEQTPKDKFAELVKKVKVFARVSPEQKLKVVESLKQSGNIVAVTGDGVNDAPAIRSANIGIAMGISGTDVSKEVADMVLEDDNYATIVEAIKQGRIIYDNLVKFIKYLISCNLSELLIVGLAVFIGLPLPLLGIQILWLNLVTDGLPALTLGVEPGEKDIMKRKPRNHKHGILYSKRWQKIVLEAILITGATLGMYIYAVQIMDIAAARTLALTTLAFAQIAHTLNNRSETHSLFSRELGFNGYLYLIIIFSLVLHFATVYTNVGNFLLKTTPIDMYYVMLAAFAALSPVIMVEMLKQLNIVYDGKSD